MFVTFGVIFCAECGSLLVNSGYAKTPTSLRCCDCSNVDSFKVGNIYLEEPLSPAIAELLNKAVDAAKVRKTREQNEKRSDFIEG